jgi:AcrR family transcriptional regulator
MTIDAASPRRAARGPYAKSGRTREHILDAALEVFAESGFRGGSLRLVAERAGLTEAGLLHHFATKKDLLAAVLERRDQQTRDQFDIRPGRGRALLTAAVALVEYDAATPDVAELFCTLAAEATAPGHPAHAYFTERYRHTTGMVRDALDDLKEHGELREGVSPAAAARATIALMDGLQIQWLLDRESVDMAADLRTYLGSLVTGEI